jgi:hypothetical protein
MAITDGTITSVGQHSTNAGPVVNGSGVPIMSCVIAATVTGTYAQGNDSRLLAVPTAIQNSRRDGKTVTMLGCTMEAPGLEGTTPIGAGPLFTISGADVVFPLTTSDMATEHSNAALSAFTRPIQFRVTYSLS